MSYITDKFVFSPLVIAIFLATVIAGAVVSANNDILIGAKVWKTGMADWANTVSVTPGEQFKISLYRGNVGVVGVNAVRLVDNLPQNTSYVSGSTYVLAADGVTWNALSDDGTSLFDGAGLNIGTLAPFDFKNYKYTVVVNNFVPHNATNLSWSGPTLFFTDSSGSTSKNNTETNTVSLTNVPAISSFALNAGVYGLGDTITVTAVGAAGKLARVEIGPISFALSGSGSNYTGTYTIKAGDNVGTTPRIYFDNGNGTGSYRDAATSVIIGDGAPVVLTPPTSGGGGPGPVPGIVSAKIISSNGGSISSILGNDFDVTITVQKETFEDGTIVAVSKASDSQITSAPLATSLGTIIKESMVSIVVNRFGVPLYNFAKPVSIRFTYNPSELGGIDPSTVYVAYYEVGLAKWTALDSVVDTSAHTVTAKIEHPGLYGLISYLRSPFLLPTSGPVNTGNTGGQVLGNTVGIYPNGTLLKTEYSPEVWYIAEDQKHLIHSAEIFESRFNWKDIVTLPSRDQIDRYTQGAGVTFAPGTLVKEAGSPAVYRVSENGDIARIVSEKVFYGRGYSFGNVVEVSRGFLSSYTHIAPIDSVYTFYTGDLVKLSYSPAVYYIENGTRRIFTSSSVFYENAFKFKNVRTITRSQFDGLYTGSAMTYPDGSLVKGDSTSVYAISDQKKRPIISGADFEALRYTWANVIRIPESMLVAISQASGLRLIIASH
ncbi:hypothetical protein BK004_03450 [bacterium CG10_46_32]|nr:MAG: hypothetical protein BK004_03450 [bacterium CG10_46_32]PIR55981.1 MAG: hypothetical protein COU73_03480 [Parcubacteria group bacterium CG10_big_fil_rev_8_21_14_0_10_46_32]